MKDYDYKHIEKVISQEDGTTNLLLRGNKQAIIEITKAENNFKAAVYHLLGYPVGWQPREKKKSLLAQFHQEGSTDVLREALGWVDENPGKFIDWKDMNINQRGVPVNHNFASAKRIQRLNAKRGRD